MFDIYCTSISDSLLALLLSPSHNSDKPLEALHLVDLTQVVITLAHPVASSIHVTHCQDCQVVPTKCQQLRIHESVRLDFQQVLLGAGAILEASEDILFGVVDDTTVLDVKDFHWLRTGVPSPNFRIVFAESSKVVEDQKAEESISTPASSVEQLAEQIETCSIQVDSSSPNIPPAKDADNSDDEDDEL